MLLLPGMAGIAPAGALTAGVGTAEEVGAATGPLAEGGTAVAGALGVDALVVGAASLVGGASAEGGAASASCEAEGAAPGGGAEVSVPARKASALYWVWAPVAASELATSRWSSVVGGADGSEARSGEAAALLVSGAEVSPPSRPVGSRLARVSQAPRLAVRPVMIANRASERANLVVMPEFDFSKDRNAQGATFARYTVPERFAPAHPHRKIR